MVAESQEVDQLTDLLRTSEDLFWARQRELLASKGHPANSLLLAESFEDDRNFEFGIVVTSDKRVLQYGVDYAGKSVEFADLVEWNEWTGDESAINRYSGIRQALSRLAAP